MTLSALGIFSAAGAGGVQGDYELIETYVLGSSQSSITFSSLGTYSSTYKHLQIRLTARTNRAEPEDYLKLRINGDSGSNYANHGLYATGSGGVLSYAATSQTFASVQRVVGSTAAANIFGGVVVDLLDSYSTSKNKTVRMLGGFTASSNGIYLSSSARFNTASITSISLEAGEGTNILTGSRFSLYGIKG
jgi:hypothetical protein